MMRLESLLTLSLFLFGDSYVCAASTSRGLSRDAENKVGCAGTPLDKLFKFEIGSYKRDNVTWDQYANYLVKVHDARARPVIKRHGVSIWTQTLTPPSARAIAAGAAASLPSGWTVPQYDSVTAYYVTDPSILQSLTSDPDWLDLVAEAAPYEDASRGTLLCGFETKEL